MAKATVHTLGNPTRTACDSVRAGQIIVLSSGDYEDASNATVLRVRCDFNPPDAVEEFLSAESAAGRLERYGPRSPYDNPDWDPEVVGYGDFCGWAALVAWLVDRGLVEKIEGAVELHLSGNGWER